AMVLRSEVGSLQVVPRQQSTRQRDPNDDADIAGLRLPEEEAGRALPEHVEDDLNGGDVRIFDRLDRLFHLLHRDAEVQDLPLLLQPIEQLEDLRSVVDRSRRTVELDEVERLQPRSGKASLDEPP